VTRQDNIVAQALLEKAIAIEPDYGQALGVLAASQTFSAHMGWADMTTTLPIAERAALAAVRADSEDPWAHHALGCVYLFTRRPDDSLAEFELALRLNPNFSLAQGFYGLALSYCGRWEEADRAARRALRLSPRDPFSAIYIGIAAYPHSSDEITTRRCGWRARPSVSAAISSALTGCSQPLPAWPEIPSSRQPRSKSYAARNPISHSPG
jgi:tetratricopeptide (TPR) repeat protein